MIFWSLSKQMMEVPRNDKHSNRRHQHCDKAPGRTVQQGRIYPGPLFPYFQPMVSGLLAFGCVEGEHVAEKTPPTLQGCLGYREMCKGETSALWVFTSHLISSHQVPTPQNSTPICHWLVIKPLWVNVGEGFLSNPRQAKGPSG